MGYSRLAYACYRRVEKEANISVESYTKEPLIFFGNGLVACRSGALVLLHRPKHCISEEMIPRRRGTDKKAKAGKRERVFVF